MDLSSVSSQLNISVQELRQKAAAAGFIISAKANKIDNQLAKKVLSVLGKKTIEQPESSIKEVELGAFVKVRDFADKLGRPVTEIIKMLIQNGIMATLNEEIDFETASIIASDLGVEAKKLEDTHKHLGLGHVQEILAEEKDGELTERPPIVAVMGHVDHGKTSLLDAIRKTDVAAGESGGITQHIGAYQTKHNSKIITFLDTPGHEAFAEMRARGANVTDLIVLVVAADDGVRPQTLEVINRAKFTDTPVIVAINKIDKEGANILKVKQELSSYGLVAEEWGGKTVMVEISAKQGQGIDQLLEMILLSAEVEGFKANPTGTTVGTVIESHSEVGKGAVATVVIQNGTLKVGDIVVAGHAYGRVKAMEDEHGKRLKTAGPAEPAQIAGFSTTAQAGDVLVIAPSIDEAKRISDSRLKEERSHKLYAKTKLTGDAASKSVKLILKSDVAGSLEAIIQSLDKLKNDEVAIQLLSSGVGEVNESDVLLAQTTGATIVAFRAKTNSQAISLAKQKKVTIDDYDVIYELLEDITSAVIALFTPEYEHKTLGRGKILAIFRTDKGEMIVGGRVDEGYIAKNKAINVWRSGELQGTAKIAELQQSKVAASEVSQGNEFGIKLETSVKIKEGDVLESFDQVLKQKTLTKDGK